MTPTELRDAVPNTSSARLAEASRVGAVLRDAGTQTTASPSNRARIGRWLYSWRFALLPLLFAIGVAIAGYWAVNTVDKAVRAGLDRQLEVTLNGGENALRVYLDAQLAAADTAAKDPRILALTEALLKLKQAQDSAAKALGSAPEQAALRNQLMAVLSRHQLEGFSLTAFDGTLLAADDKASIGQPSTLRHTRFMRRAFAGTPTLSGPQVVSMHGLHALGEKAHQEHVFSAEAPIRNAQGKVLASLGLRSLPRVIFTQILEDLAFGETGETYIFDREAVMLSSSRFAKQLASLPLGGHLSGDLRVDIPLLDPGVDLTVPENAAQVHNILERPRTEMARCAVQGHTDAHLSGYRSYRGTEVVGSWRWLKDIDVGVVSEIASGEAFELRRTLRAVVWVLVALLLLGAVVGLAYSVFIQRLGKRVDRAERLGQYKLKQKLGEGGMGAVYLAEHALLRRPTAVKLIRADNASNEAIARFEREVQLTAQLSHPNTIAVYDYGRTHEGIFYYAMEYIDGIDLELLVRRHGPQAPERVVHILLGIVGSLREAHAAGMVHRDIKPSNVMLCESGGESDRVKVLDFGLVKQMMAKVDDAIHANLTADFVITGTPHFLAPESTRGAAHTDFRSDLYAVGAVAYWLLAGEHLFGHTDTMAVIQAQLFEAPRGLNERGIALPRELEQIIERCLNKDPANRYPSTDELYDALEAYARAQAEPWTMKRAKAWWHTSRTQAPPSPVSQSDGSLDPTQLATPSV